MAAIEFDRASKPCLHPRARHQHGTYIAYDRDGCRCRLCYVARVQYRAVVSRSDRMPADRVREHVVLLLTVLTVAQVARRSGVDRTVLRRLVGIFPGEPRSKRIGRVAGAALLAVRPVRFGSETGGLVDGTGTRRRLRALIALGWTACALAARLGLSAHTLWRLTNVDSGLVKVQTRDLVVRLYDEVSMVIPPPSQGATRSRNAARARGWVPPLAWDDDTIDDPDAEPSDELDADVDEVAVCRAVAGDLDCPLRVAERRMAVERLARQGLDDSSIAARLCVTSRTVFRDRQVLGAPSRWKMDAA